MHLPPASAHPRGGDGGGGGGGGSGGAPAAAPLAQVGPLPRSGVVHRPIQQRWLAGLAPWTWYCHTKQAASTQQARLQAATLASPAAAAFSPEHVAPVVVLKGGQTTRGGAGAGGLGLGGDGRGGGGSSVKRHA